MFPIMGRMYPKKLKSNIENLLMYCKIKTNVDEYIGGAFLMSLFIGIALSAVIRIFVDFSFILMAIVSIILINASIYATLVLNADHRAQFVEDILPDALQLMSANLRAGMTVDRALVLAARPEFGDFQEEINRVGREVATGKELSTSLMNLAGRIRSDKLKKTFQLIVTGMATGGQLSDLLEQTATNLRQQRLVEQRIRSNVLVYVIFIFSAIGFGAPMLFSLSSFLVEVITDIFGKIQLPPGGVSGSIPISFTQISISPSFVRTYTIVSMIVTSVLGSLILGLVGKGKEKEGLKYLPILLILTISLYFLVKFFISQLLSGLFQL